MDEKKAIDRLLWAVDNAIWMESAEGKLKAGSGSGHLSREDIIKELRNARIKVGEERQKKKVGYPKKKYVMAQGTFLDEAVRSVDKVIEDGWTRQGKAPQGETYIAVLPEKMPFFTKRWHGSEGKTEKEIAPFMDAIDNVVCDLIRIKKTG